MPVVRVAVAVVHALAGAAWVGSMFYSMTVLHPRGRAFFETARDFEDFIAFLSQGARWKVLGAFAIVGASGLALVPMTSPAGGSSAWMACLAIKAILFAVALAVFCYTSWRLWPRRILAGPAEVPRIQRTFRGVGVAMIVLVGSAFALGVAAHASRG